MDEFAFLLDENIPHALRDQLWRQTPNLSVRCIGDDDAPPLGQPDPEILCWLEEHRCLLITRNCRSMPQHLRDHLASGRRVPGLFLVRPAQHLGDVAEDIHLILQAAKPSEFLDRITYLPL